jgi:hypothetical protein
MPRHLKRPEPVETIDLPHEYIVFADARIAAIIRRCCADANIVESVARSCYLQGVQDGVQVVLEKPSLLDELKGAFDVDQTRPGDRGDQVLRGDGAEPGAPGAGALPADAAPADAVPSEDPGRPED